MTLLDILILLLIVLAVIIVFFTGLLVWFLWMLLNQVAEELKETNRNWDKY